MIKENFAIGNSLIHKMDPRYKIVSAALFSIVIALSSKFYTLSMGFTFSVILVLIANLNFVQLLKRLSVVFGFIIFIWIIVPVTFQGEPFYVILGITIKKQGILFAARITIKSITILTALTALTATMTITSVGHALSRMLIPDKIVFLLLITYRYIFVIEKEYKRLLNAAKIRGFKPTTSIHSYKTYSYFIGMLFVKSAERSKRVHQAMMCRGFNGRFHSLTEFKPAAHNTILFGIILLFILSIIFIEFFSSYFF